MTEPCMVEAYGGPCGRRKGHGGNHATIAAHHLDEKEDLRAVIASARHALLSLCLERGSTDGFVDLLRQMNEALNG